MPATRPHYPKPLGAQGFDIEDSDAEVVYGTLARKLKPLNLAYVHVMRGPSFDAVGLLRKEYGGTLIAGGGYDGKSGQEALEKGQVLERILELSA